MDTVKSLLSNIDFPNDLRKLSINELPQVCKEVREYIIDTLAEVGGTFCIKSRSSGINSSLALCLQYTY